MLKLTEVSEGLCRDPTCGWKLVTSCVMKCDACLSVIIDEQGFTGQSLVGRRARCSGVRLTGRVHWCSCEECEEGSSWQTVVHSQSVRGCNDEAPYVSSRSFQA